MNKLSAETSPYLLQHQHNPVNWYAWSQEAWQKAKNEDKLVLISIGYSACHWCHVMEREVFEDEECGKFMNQHFVCIKVDREERPDIDSIYMDAIHLMGGRGGWPLNAFALPDGRPVYGGTYFPKEQWLTILENLTSLFKNEPTKIIEYADRLHNGLKEISLISNNPVDSSFELPLLESSILNWSKSWDFEKGGAKKAPKFPMPNNLELLLQYGIQSKNASAVDFVNITLEKMALGGIYDQVGGGFCRYSVDDIWKVPHFEKMLYDNAQLISIYAQAYRQSGNTHYKNVVLETIDWLEREMLAPSGLFFSALDADSDGVEGKFYVWTLDELKTLLGEDFDFALRLYCLDQHDEWEHGQYILLRSMNDASLAKDMQISESEVASARQRINQLLLNARGSRTRPGLDDKCLTSWNAMMVKAYTEAYNSFGEAKYLNSAEKLAENMWTHLAAPDGVLWHCYTKGKAKINGFHDDYANLIEAFIFLYESGMNGRYLTLAHDLLKLTITLFYDSEDGLFYFTPSTSEVLITRKKEIQDNVTPASNSVMSKSLFRLGRHLDEKEYVMMSERMLKNVLPQMNYASGYSNWLEVYCWNALPFHDVVICGESAGNALNELISGYFPGCLFAASTMKSEWPLFHNRFGTNTAIYVCSDNVCHAPVESAKEALLLIK